MEDLEFETICEVDDPDERVTVMKMKDEFGTFFLFYRHCGERLKTVAKICLEDNSKNEILEDLTPLVLKTIRDINNGL